MDYDDLNRLIDKLLSAENKVSDYKDRSTDVLRAIGRQLALKYRHITDKDSDEAKKYLTILIEVRQSVRSKQNIQDIMVLRYQKQNI